MVLGLIQKIGNNFNVIYFFTEWSHHVILDRAGNFHFYWTPLQEKIIVEIQVCCYRSQHQSMCKFRFCVKRIKQIKRIRDQIVNRIGPKFETNQTNETNQTKY